MTNAIRQIGDPILHAVPRPVDFADQDFNLESIIEVMAAQLTERGGVGIACNQCAAFENPYRIVIVGVYDEEKRVLAQQRYPGREFPEARVMINPRIVDVAGKECFPGEGCLSVQGGMRAKVARYPRVLVEFTDEQQQIHSEWLTDFAAHIAQHECQHLDGILYLHSIFDELPRSVLDDIVREIKAELNYRQMAQPIAHSPGIYLTFDRDENNRLIVDDDMLAASIHSMPEVTLHGVLLEIAKRS